MSLHASSRESWMNTVWGALEGYRENCIPPDDPQYDEEWDDICTAMAWIRESLGLPDEVDLD